MPEAEAGVDLAHLHEAPWSHIEGAYVRVRQEVTDDPLPPHGGAPERHTEVREGTIAGRHRGWKVKWLPDEGDVAEPVSPRIVIETPEETYLEVTTDGLENELLDFEPAEGTDA